MSSRFYVSRVLAIFAISCFCAGAQAEWVGTNIDFTLNRINGNANFDENDIFVFPHRDVYVRGGVPFYLHGQNGVIKTQPAASNEVDTSFEADVTSTVPNAVGVFLLGATDGTFPNNVTSVGHVEYSFDNGTTVIGNIEFSDHYVIKELTSATLGVEPANESPKGTIYTTVDGHLAEYNLTVIYHSFPEGTLTGVKIVDTPDEGEGSDTVNAPVWIYGVTVARKK